MRRFLRLSLLAVMAAGAIFPAVATEPSAARRWTDASGLYSVWAELVELRPDLVRLRRTDGRVVEVALHRLSQNDQDFLQRHARNATAPPQTSMAVPPHAQQVLAEGVGLSAAEALRDALQQAVCQVVGSVVDAETLIHNDQLIEEQIRIHSSGLVRSYRKLWEEERGGWVRVRISAVVERQQLMARLCGMNLRNNSFPGADLFAQVVTRQEAEQSAGRLLENAFRDYPANVLKAEVTDPPRVHSRDARQVTLSYHVTVSVDVARYEQFRRQLVQTLSQIATKKGNSRGVLALHGPRRGTALGAGDDSAGFFPETLYFPDYPLRLAPKFGDWGTREIDFRHQMVVLVNTGRNPQHTQTAWQWFHVARPQQTLLSGAEATIRFLDGAERCVASDSLRVDAQSIAPALAIHDLRSGGWMRFSADRQHYAAVIEALPEAPHNPGRERAAHRAAPVDAVVIVSPYFICVDHSNTEYFNDTFYPQRVIPRRITLELEQLQEITRIESVLASAAPWVAP